MATGTAPRHWTRVCALDDILPQSGVAALAGRHQIALFRVNDGIYAISNHDPGSGANVLARGIVGNLGDEIVVASPIYKHHYSLSTGRCLEDPELCVPVYSARVQDGQVWVRPEASAIRHPSRQRLVVVGGGMAALRTLDELLALAPDAFDITIFDAESQVGYNRILLSPLLAGETGVADILTHPEDWYAKNGITLHRGDPVDHIDRARRVVHSRAGLAVAYDRLLLATGSQAVTLPLPGAELPGIMTFRNLQDVETMLAAAARGGQAVVIGGGLLGLEAANGLLKRGMQVTVVHLLPHLMERQLDKPAATLLREEFERRGVSFILPARTAGFVGTERVSGVRFADDREVPADLVVVAAGVKPNTGLARRAGLRCARGVLVDDTLMSFDPSIYAVGECVQHRGVTFGLVAPLWEQAKVCATQLAGKGLRGYRSTHHPTQLKVGGIDLFSAGDCTDRPGCESLVMRDPARGIYRRLILEQDRLRGAVLYGDIRSGRWYTDLIRQGGDVSAMREQLLFGEPA